MKRLYKKNVVCVCGHKRSEHIVSKVQMGGCFECNLPLIEWHREHKIWKREGCRDIEPPVPNTDLCFDFRPDNLRTLEQLSEKVV